MGYPVQGKLLLGIQSSHFNTEVTNVYVSSVVIDNLYSQFYNHPDIGIACLYANYKDQIDQTPVNILGSFLHQLLTTSSEPIPDEVTQKLYDIHRHRGKPGMEDNLALLRIRLHQLKCAFICIDAIDELAPEVQRQLLLILKELRNIRLFLTGRDHIETEVQKRLQVIPKYKVVISACQQDIQEYVEQKIKEDWNPDAMDEVLAQDIADTIISKSQGM